MSVFCSGALVFLATLRSANMLVARDRIVISISVLVKSIHLEPEDTTAQEAKPSDGRDLRLSAISSRPQALRFGKESQQQ